MWRATTTRRRCLNNSHQDSLQSRLDKALGRKDQLYGGFAFQSTRSDSVNLFGFVDQTGNAGHQRQHPLDAPPEAAAVSVHQLHLQQAAHRGDAELCESCERFGRSRNQRKRSGCGELGTSGAEFCFWLYGDERRQQLIQSQPHGRRFGIDSLLSRQAQHFSRAVDFRKQDYNDFFQQNPRGGFTFTGAETAGPAGAAASGSDLADFLIGVPDTSSIAYGNADKYFREPVYDVYFQRRLARDADSYHQCRTCGGTTARRSRSCLGGW